MKHGMVISISLPEKISKFQTCIEHFNTIHDGINMLRSLAEQFEIDYRFCKYCTAEGETLKNDDVSNLPELIIHNEKIENAITFLLSNRPSFAVIDKGRSADERSCIWVEKGHFYGMGYISSDVGITEPHEIKNYVNPYRSNQYIMQLIYSYIQKYPGKVFSVKES